MLETSQVSAVAAIPVVRRPRLGFAGVGWIGRNRMEAIADAQCAEICAISDPALNAATTFDACGKNIPVVGSFDALLREELDGILIATPSALHADQAIAALEHGKAVFCQKPLARTGAETRRAFDAARHADRLLGVDLSYRATTGMRRIRDLIRRGALGEIYAVEMVFHNAYGPDKPWFYDPRLSGGGCLIDLGIHHLDLALWCLGYPKVERVSGHLLSRGARWTPRCESVEDYATAQITVNTGAVITVSCSWRAPAGTNARIEATFFGSGGGASFRNLEGSFYDFTAEHLLPDRSRRLLASPPDAWGGRVAVDWARRLAGTPEFDPEIEHLAIVADALDQIYGHA